MKKLFILLNLALLLIATNSDAAVRIHHAERNIADTATTTCFTLNSSTSVKVRDSGPISVNVIFTNGSNFDVWLKFQAASVDDLKEGIVLMSGTNVALAFEDGFYVGEVSAIAFVDNPVICRTEY